MCTCIQGMKHSVESENSFLPTVHTAVWLTVFWLTYDEFSMLINISNHSPRCNFSSYNLLQNTTFISAEKTEAAPSRRSLDRNTYFFIVQTKSSPGFEPSL